MLAAYDKLVAFVEHLDRHAIKTAIEHAALVTADEATLFELLTTFRLVDALREHGWQLQPFHLFHGAVRTRGQHQDGRQLDLWWYQSTPPGLTTGSRYKKTLASHGFPRPHDLRPDLVLTWTNPQHYQQWLLVECKLSQTKGAGHAARRALIDLLAYRRSFDAALQPASHPYGLGVAWGAGLQLAGNAEVALCTPDTISEAVKRIIT